MQLTKTFIYFFLALGGASAQARDELDDIALAARGEEMVRRGLELLARVNKKPPPTCVPDGGNGECVLIDGGKAKTISCSPDHKCTRNRGACTWTAGFATCY